MVRDGTAPQKSEMMNDGSVSVVVSGEDQ